MCAGNTALNVGRDPGSTFKRAAPRLGADSRADFQRAARRTDGQSGGAEPGVGGRHPFLVNDVDILYFECQAYPSYFGTLEVLLHLSHKSTHVAPVPWRNCSRK